MSKVAVNIRQPKKASAEILGVSVTESRDYNSLRNKPSVNGVTLQGDLSLDDLGIMNLASLEYEEVST